MAYKIPKTKQREKPYQIEEKSSTTKPTIYNEGEARVFKINEKMQIYAKAGKTRNGFKHTATLMVDGQPVDTTTAHYLNRTWESYEYQSVVDNLIDKSGYIIPAEKEKLKKIFSEESHQQIESQFKSIGMIAQLGDVFATSKKDKNVWKLRMVKAGLGENISLPEDWETLSEDEKEIRLNKIITFMKKEKK